MQPDDFAAMVVLTVKTAMAPVLERLAVAEQRNHELQARVVELAGVRDRVTAMETKSAMPTPVVESVLPPPVDFSPILERVAATEAQVKAIGDLRDRVVVVETKTAQPHPPAVAPEKADLTPVLERLSALELGLQLKFAEAAPVLGAVAGLTKDMGSVRERLAVVEVRPPVPGPQGEPGVPGKDGKDGEPGTAGLSFEGVYQEGKAYDFGNLVTWGGSSWHCNETTTSKPGDGSKAWTLMVKRGRDGKDGQDAPSLPVVSVGGR